MSKIHNTKYFIQNTLKRIRLRTWISIGIIVVLSPILFAAAYGILGALGGSSATPIAHWAFDEGVDNTCSGGTNDACDSSGNGNDLAFGDETAAPTWQTEDKCVSGKCLLFDGTEDESLRNALLTDAFTVSGWFKANANNGIMFWQQETQIFLQSNGIINARLFNGSSSFSTTSETLSLNRWYHITFSYDGSSTLNLYIDGKLVSTNSGASGSPQSAPLRIGKDETTTYFRGFIDEWKIFDSALSEAQVKAEFAGGAAVLGQQDNKDFLSEGLMGYWSMDDNVSGNAQSIIDSSGNSRTATTSDGANDTGIDCTVSGKFGSGCEFDGTDDTLTLTTDYATTNQITISGWYSTDTLSLPLAHRMIYTSTNSASYLSLNVNNSANPFFSLTIGGTQRTLSSSVASTVGKMTHVVGTYDGNNMRIYVDGILRNTSAQFQGAISGFSGSGTHRIGSYISDTAPFSGMIDDVRVYNRALSPSEVQKLYNWAPGPIGHWKMDENTGTSTTADSSGNGAGGSLVSMTNDSWVPGKYGSALNFDGTADYIDVYSSSLGANFNSSQGTIEAWIKIPDDSIWEISDSGIIARFATDNNNSVHMMRLEDDLYWIYRAGGTTTTVTKTTLTSNDWIHMALTWDTSSDEMKAYFNGVQEGSTQTSLGTWSGSLESQLALIGALTPTPLSLFSGYIDEVKVYNYPRTPQQIVEDMNGGHPTGGSPISNQLLHWKFDDMNGSTANDSTSSGYDGTLGGATLPSWTQSGKYSGALFFTAVSGATTGSRVTYSTPGNVALGTTTGDQLTLTMWLNPDSTQTNTSTGFFVRNGNSTDANYAAFLSSLSNGHFLLTFTYHDGTNFRNLATTGRHITADEWNHIGLVMTQGTNVKVYVNGTLRETLAWSGSNSVTPTTSFNIGGHAGAQSQSVDGYIDEVKVYRGGLTDDQIKIDMNQGASINFGGGVDGSADTISGAITPPLAHWDMNEKVSGDAQTLLDKSGNGYNLTTVDGANNTGINCSAPGKYGSSCLLDGADDYASLANPSFDDFGTGDMSVSAWIKYTSTPSAGYVIVGNKTAGTNNAGFSLEINTTNLAQMRVANGSAQASAVSTGVANNDGQWHHLVGVFERGSSDRVLIYVDGRLISTGTAGATGWNISSSQALLLGAYGTSANNGNFNGNIDDVKIFDYALTASQVAYEFNQGAPIAWFKMDECTGTTLNDAGALPKTDLTLNIGSSGSNTSAGDCSSGTGSEAWNNGTTGKYYSAMDFDGTDDYAVYAGQIADNPMEQISFGAWINPDNTTATQVVMEQISGVFQINRSTTTWSILVTNASATTVSVAGGTATAGTWTHVMGTYDGANVKLYVNGVLVNQASQTGALRSSVNHFMLGCDGNTSDACLTYFAGKIDDVRIYGYALSDEQVKQAYNEGSAVRF